MLDICRLASYVPKGKEKQAMKDVYKRQIYNTTEQWLEQFPFWSESTLKRAFASMKTLGLLRCEKLNKSKRDMTNFYTINYGSELLDGGKLNESIGSKCAAPSGQNDTMEEVKMKRSIGSKPVSYTHLDVYKRQR